VKPGDRVQTPLGFGHILTISKEPDLLLDKPIRGKTIALVAHDNGARHAWQLSQLSPARPVAQPLEPT
jgi:hypothetical protein